PPPPPPFFAGAPRSERTGRPTPSLSHPIYRSISHVSDPSTTRKRVPWPGCSSNLPFHRRFPTREPSAPSTRLLPIPIKVPHSVSPPIHPPTSSFPLGDSATGPPFVHTGSFPRKCVASDHRCSPDIPWPLPPGCKTPPPGRHRRPDPFRERKPTDPAPFCIR